MTSNRKGKERKLKASQIAILRGVLLFLLFFFLNLVVENRDLYESDDALCEAGTAGSAPLGYEHTYTSLTNGWIGRSSSEQVGVVFIPEDAVDVQQNVCLGRDYLAGVIRALTTQRPTAIVLDKFFSQKACEMPSGEQDENTKHLESAMEDAGSVGVAIIVGKATQSAEHGTDETCLLDLPGALHFSSDNVHFGLTKLNANREQIPLQWQVSGRPEPSLSRVTAEIVAPEATSKKKFTSMLERGVRQPYARLELELPSASSEDLLAGNQEAVRVSQHKVVVVGSRNSSDRWTALGKRYWGYQLQAAYIDALISGKYLKAVSTSWVVLLSILFIFLLEAVPFACEYACRFKRCRKIPFVAKLSEFWIWIWVWPPIFVVTVFLVCLLLGFLPPISVLTEALLIMLARILFDRMDYFQKHMDPEAKETRS